MKLVRQVGNFLFGFGIVMATFGMIAGDSFHSVLGGFLLGVGSVLKEMEAEA